MKDQIIRHLSAADPVLKGVMDSVQWPEISSTGNVFNDLMSCIIEQQIHYRSTKGWFLNMLERASLDSLRLDNFETFESKALGTVKLSMRKYETMARVVDFFQHNQRGWQGMEDAEVRKLLSDIKGIGNWTIDMILMYTLERPNIFPAQDYHVKKIMSELYEIGDLKKLTSEMRSIAEDWAPYRSIAVKYLFAWKEARKKALI